MCDASGEDPTCSDSIRAFSLLLRTTTLTQLINITKASGGIDLAHLTYFNRLADTPFCT